MDNRLTIDHLYGNILKRNKELHSRLPSSECWQTVQMAHLTMKDTLKSIKMNQFKYLFVSNAFRDTVIIYISNFGPCADVQRQVEALKELYLNGDVAVPEWIDDLNTVLRDMKAIVK